MADIHPTAVVDPAARLDSGVRVGPYCVIGADVQVGADTSFGPGMVVSGPTVIGTGNNFYGQASIGGDSQDLKGADGRLEIGDRNKVREFVTINRGTKSGSATKVGNDNLLMSYSHIAHDCVLGNRIVIANAVQIAGEVSIDSQAIIGGACAVHQRVRIGKLAIIGGMTCVRQDVPPFANYTINGDRVVLTVNRIGLERAGMKESIAAIKQSQRILYSKGLAMNEAIEQIAQMAKDNEVLAPLAEFLSKPSEYGLARPRTRHRS